MRMKSLVILYVLLIYMYVDGFVSYEYGIYHQQRQITPNKSYPLVQVPNINIDRFKRNIVDDAIDTVKEHADGIRKNGIEHLWNEGSEWATSPSGIASLSVWGLDQLGVIDEEDIYLPTLASEKHLKNLAVMRSIGRLAGSWIGTAIGTPFGPWGQAIGSIVGKFIGDVVARIICFFICGRSQPKPDEVPPRLFCYGKHIVAKPNRITATIAFPRAKASDNKEGDVSHSVYMEMLIGPTPDKIQTDSGIVYVSTFEEGEYFYRFHARDSIGNRGFCDTHIQVQVLRCQPPPIIDHASYKNNYKVLGGLTLYRCHHGYMLVGSQLLKCMRIDSTFNAKWSPQHPVCGVTKCKEPTSVSNGRIVCKIEGRPYTAPCYQGQCDFLTKCTYSCDEGYKIGNGPRSILLCKDNGQWDSPTPICKDASPPQLVPYSCPRHIVKYLAKLEEQIAFPKIEIPEYIDNEGAVTITQRLGPSSGDIVYEGTYIVKYEAKDRIGNTNTDCTIRIDVIALTCPPLLYTESMEEPSCTHGFQYGSTCTFSCHNNVTVDGAQNASCEAKGNPPTSIWVFEKNQLPYCKGKTCAPLDKPFDGNLDCDIWWYGQFCQPTCNDRYAFNTQKETPFLYHCNYADGLWIPRSEVDDCMTCLPAKEATIKATLQHMSENCSNTALSVRNLMEINCGHLFNEIQHFKVKTSQDCNNTTKVSSIWVTISNPENLLHYSSKIVQFESSARMCFEKIHESILETKKKKVPTATLR